MTDANLRSTSKFLSYVLRHNPESIDLELDRRGWAHLPELIEKANRHGRKLSRDRVRKVLNKGEKQRFSLSRDEEYIRAGYGHSIDVDLDLEPQRPPRKLFHGTARRNIGSIRKRGLISGNRNLVHLSAGQEEARAVGRRHGRPRVLPVRAEAMYEAGHPFYRSDSEAGIWMTERVPPEFIDFGIL